MEGKAARHSRTILTDHVLPPDTNYHNTIFGGKVMAYIDKVSAMAAMRHCRKPVVTASMDSMDFLAPIKVGEAIYLEAIVTWSHHTSMEVHVIVEAEDLLTGERKRTGSSYLTFVALDDAGKPTPVPPVIPETEEEKWQFETAQERYDLRKQRKSEREQEHRSAPR